MEATGSLPLVRVEEEFLARILVRNQVTHTVRVIRAELCVECTSSLSLTLDREATAAAANPLSRSLLAIQGRKHPFLSSAHAVALMQEAKEEVVMMIASSLGDANQMGRRKQATHVVCSRFLHTMSAERRVTLSFPFLQLHSESGVTIRSSRRAISARLSPSERGSRVLVGASHSKRETLAAAACLPLLLRIPRRLL